MHTRTLTGSDYINNLYPAQDRSVPSERKKIRGEGEGMGIIDSVILPGYSQVQREEEVRSSKPETVLRP